MVVTLNVGNDEELRNWVKDLVRGQLVKIGREEYIENVKQETKRKVEAAYKLDFIIQDAIKAETKSLLNQDYHTRFTHPAFINAVITAAQPHIEKALENVDWKALVEQLAKEKMRALVQ